jgi:acid phosphatase type 7
MSRPQHSSAAAGSPFGTLTPGQVPPRPPRNSSQAHPGVHPLSQFTHGTQKFQPLPNPLVAPPYHYDLETAIPGIGDRARAQGSLVFHAVGDTGGIKNPDYQTHVAAAMKTDLNKPPKEAPSFFYHLGDVVYYNGQIAEYYSQFYEPYNHYSVPILGIPGNHDGDPTDPSQTSLDGWVAYFMTPAPRINPESHDAPRATMSLPNVYYTLNCPFVTIIGLYDNVPEHGSIDSQQQQWLTNEFATAPEDRALILALHHPVYSFDDHHAGSPLMADAVQHAINDSRRLPNLVLTAHVHNYQRIEREAVIGDEGTMIPFIVAGAGGYYHLHGLNVQPPAPGKKLGVIEDPQTHARLVASNMHNHGYLTITVDKNKISGVVSTIDELKYPGNSADDTFSYAARVAKLSSGKIVSL